MCVRLCQTHDAITGFCRVSFSHSPLQSLLAAREFIFLNMSLTTEQKDGISTILKAAEGGQLVASMQKLYGFLQSQSLAFSLQIPPDQVGIHEDNRDGLGCSVTQMQELMTDISQVGFHHGSTNAICIEAGSGPDLTNALDFNRLSALDIV